MPTYRLTAQSDPSCPEGTKLVSIPAPAGADTRILVPAAVADVVVIVDNDGKLAWIEDARTGRGILSQVKPASS